MTIIMQNWISIFRDKAKKQQWQKEMIQTNQLVTREDLLQFDRSDTIVKGEAENASSGVETKTPTIMEFALVRDYSFVLRQCISYRSNCKYDLWRIQKC